MENASSLSWGRVHRFAQAVVDSSCMGDICTSSNQSVLPYGLGRSYGDSCLNEDGILLETCRHNHFIEFNRERGILKCESGVTLRDILLLCSLPNADGSFWFLPVTPGTKYVTVGGAIANDVHGKNHHLKGTFGNHVHSLLLRRSDGSHLTCSPSENVDYFNATIGGLGLTGLIEEATLQLMPVKGLSIEVEDIVINNLEDFYRLSKDSEIDWDYTVAWVDCLARGKDTGRGIFSRARHVAESVQNSELHPTISIPCVPSRSAVNHLTLTAFNTLYRHKHLGSKITKKVVHFDKFFYPLDRIGRWNRLYGRAGFYQYQCVIPQTEARSFIGAQLNEIAKSGEGSFLIVLKTFGDIKSPGLLSFPLLGTTLAIDFPNRGKSTRDLLQRLDKLTLEAGGRVYPAKDGRMTASAFHRFYPEFEQFSHYKDPRFSSNFWRRVTSSES